ncbi:ubiquinone biosynthesis O-methyltransferase [Methanobrevibacter cuticularis]|uniref:Ubiquinone biosynthesis O-methyltransferase n=1 Tax=Methanobrevibacter cuticularis TaxID=47311 RepID=A0A166EAY3_9EURY|nr:class I SAM-dependent methyltransferase [Methanobrevibacter cuticularis]KZX16461.1 ubiquinone biosynthesis O-methyltransferase [Methanobrevibacter cuticularis]
MKGNLSYIKIDANKILPFENEEFDFILSVDTIEHLENPWVFVEEIHRILKVNGTVILTTPNVENLVSRILYLLFGQFMSFNNGLLKVNHISPIFSWIFDFMISKKFKIKKTYYYPGHYLFLSARICNLRLPFKNKYFGENIVRKMKKI